MSQTPFPQLPNGITDKIITKMKMMEAKERNIQVYDFDDKYEFKNFYIDDTYYGGFLWKPDNTWNGWDIPYFTKEQLDYELKNNECFNYKKWIILNYGEFHYSSNHNGDDDFDVIGQNEDGLYYIDGFTFEIKEEDDEDEDDENDT